MKTKPSLCLAVSAFEDKNTYGCGRIFRVIAEVRGFSVDDDGVRNMERLWSHEAGGEWKATEFKATIYASVGGRLQGDFYVRDNDNHLPGLGLSQARAAVKVLTVLDKRLRKMTDARGYAVTFGEQVARFAEAVGARFVALDNSDSRSWEFMFASQARSVIDTRVARFELECGIGVPAEAAA